MKRVLLALGVVFAAFFILPSAAQAQTSCYPTCAPTVTSSSSSVVPGGPITLQTQGFCAGANVTFRVGGTTVGTATAGTNGTATLQTSAPATAGTYTVQAQSADPCALTASSTITVTSPTATTVGPVLPPTGSEPMNWTRAGIVAVLIGLGLVGAARLRRRPASAS
jgi:hypothetical protein